MIIDKGGMFGDLKKFIVTCNGEDISQTVGKVELYQDIFLPSWTARIHVSDSNNMLMLLPVKPGVEVTIEVETKCGSEIGDGTKKFTMYVFSISDRQFQNQRHCTYIINVASKSFLINQSKRLSKAFSKKKVEKIVEEIVSENLGGSIDKKEETDQEYHVIIPNWSPYTAIQWCTKLAIKDGAADFMFFMKDEDKYWFKPIEKLYTDEKTGVTFELKPTNMRNEAGDFDTDYCKMISSYHFDHYEGLSNLAAGYYKNKLLSYDVINKKWESKLFSFGDDISEDKEKKPWDSEIFDNADDASVSFMPKHPGLHENPTMDDTLTTWHPSRKTNLLKLNQDRLIIQVPGGVKLWEFLGKSCEVDLPSQQDVEEGKEFDEQFKGSYLVVAVAHFFGKDAYMANLELVKKRHERTLGS